MARGGGGGGGGVLPMWWVIHMCRGFDPLFSLWQDRARSFWGIFLIHQQQSYLLGYKNYQFLQKSIFLAPNSIFSSIFLGPIFSGQRHTPISFQAEYPPRGYGQIEVLPNCSYLDLIMQIDANNEKQENVFENYGCRAKCMFVLPTMCEMGLLLWIS